MLAKVLFTFTKGLLVANLVVGKKRPSARAADVVSPPGIHRPGQAATVRAGLGEARRDETVAALGQHLVDPSTGRRRIRRRPVPHQALRPPQLTVNPTTDPAELMMFTSLPRPPRGAHWPAPLRVIILVIILAIVLAMTGLGYAPEAALGLVVVAAAIADDPEMIRAILGA